MLTSDDPLSSVWKRPLSHFSRPSTRLICRILLTLFGNRISAVRGLEHVTHANDPFVFACSHSQRLEAILIPTLLLFARDGRSIHFIADWNTLMVPIAGSLLRRSEVIVVDRKDARPRFLNALKPLLARDAKPMRHALRHLRNGSPIGVFPEGTMNRDPRRLLPGKLGAAHLSLATGVPVVPAGIRFPTHDPTQPIGDTSQMEIRIGEPMFLGTTASGTRKDRVPEWHATVMTEIARLSGKDWIGEGGMNEHR